MIVQLVLSRVRLGLALIALVVTAALVVPATAGLAKALPGPARSCAKSAATAVAAARAAAECHGPVEVAAEISEKTDVYANPDGSFTAHLAATVQRVRGAGGAWIKPDPTLHRDAGARVAPVATALRMSFSGGGDGPLVTLGRGASELALHWPGRLPTPAVAAATATYAEVLPGVDLMLTAQPEGFSEVLVVKTAAAAAAPGLASVRFAATTRGLRLVSAGSGALTAVDATGATLFGSGTPAMWDSTPAAVGPLPSGSQRRASARTAGSASARRAMPVQLTGGAIVVHPDLALLRGRTTTYPVYIDPAFGASAWTMINSRFSTQSYWSFDRNDCPSPYTGVQCAKVGYTDSGTTMIYRSLFRFPSAGFAGRHVLDAKLSMDTVYSWTNTNYPTSVHLASGINAGTTWSNNAGTWQGALATANSHAYDRVRRRTEWGVTGAAQAAVAHHWPDLTLGLRATNESNHNYWKKFDAGTAVLTVTYNSYPNAPDKLGANGTSCATGAGRPYVKTLTPELRARASDPDGAARSLMVTYYWWPLNGGTRNATDAVRQSGVASGTQSVISIPAGKLTDGVTYVLQAETYDGIDVSQLSPACEFAIDVSAPGAPGGVSSTDYPSDGQGHGGAGVAGAFTLRPPSTVPGDFTGFAYTLDPGLQPAAATQVTTTAADHTAAIALTPPTDGPATLRVWSRDAAGNYSPTAASYPFVVKAGAGPDAYWAFDEGTGNSTADRSGHGNIATLSGASWTPSRGLSGSAVLGTALSAGPLATRNPVDGSATHVRTNANFTVSAWVRLDATSATAHRTAVSQDGGHTSAFLLGYDGPNNRWWFAMAPNDSDVVSLVTVRSDAAPAVGVWTQLTATYDASTHLLRLYVNGVAQAGTATLTGGFDATGPVAIGRGKAISNLGDTFTGAVDDVRIYARVLSTTEAQFTDPLRPERPLVTFPAGTNALVGQPLQVTLSGGGDTTVTSIRYSLGTETLSSVVSGNQATVTVTRSVPGEVQFFAAAVNVAGRASASTVAVVSFGSAPALSGTVTDAAGNPVAGAVVHLAPADATATTGANGGYSFPGVASGTYTVSVAVESACGLYASTAVEVTGATVTDLALAPQSDIFGYTCTATTGQPLVAADTMLDLTGDDETQAVTLPFPVSLYGNTFSTGWVSTNGLVTFADPGADEQSHPASIPDTASPNALVAPFWDDLYLDDTAGVYVKTTGTAPNRQFIVEWRNVSFFNEPADLSKRLTFEAIFAENGGITFGYSGLDDDVERGAGAAVGIESAGGGYGLQYSFQTPSLASGTQVRYRYPADARPIPLWTILGSVTRAGAAAAGVPVTLLPQGTATVTDASGHYQFANLEPDGYTVAASDGCRAASSGIDLAGNATVNLAIVGLTDTAGYGCTTTASAYFPANTTVLPLTGDDAELAVPLPFAIPLYGQSYTSAWVSTNGFISFADPAGNVIDDRAAVPDGAKPNAAVYGYWDDLVVDSGSSVRSSTTGAAPHRQYIVEWRNVRFFDRADLRVTFEIALSEDGTVTLSYRDLDEDGEFGTHTVVGIENAAGDAGFTYSAFQQLLSDGTTVVFHPPAP